MLLVTGITGHTGKYFLQELINNKYEGPIRCIVRETSETSLLDSSGLNIEKVIGDLNDPKFIDSVMDDIETVMHIYNIHHSPMMVRAAIDKKVNRIILVHTTGIYSNFKSASEKYREIEKKVFEMSNNNACETKITILRPTMIYGSISDGNMSKFIKMVDKLRVIPVINRGENLLQPVYAEDLGKAFFTVLMTPEKTKGKAYDLSGEQPIKMIDVFKLISAEFDKKILFIKVPLFVGLFIAKTLKTITLNRIDYIEKVQRMSEDRSYSHEDATIDFSYNPTKFRDGIRQEVAEYLGAKQRKWRKY